MRGSLLTMALFGCAARPEAPASRPPLAEKDYPGLLRPPAALGVEVMWRQRVTVEWGDAERRSFEAVLQNQGGALRLVGLSPLGTVGFVISLSDGAVTFDNHMSETLPFPPRFLLLDVERVFFPWLAANGDRSIDGVAIDGERSATVEAERVVEVWSDQRLRERRFTRLDGHPAGDIVIHYEWGEPTWRAPTRVVFDNGWFRYRLTIDTLQETLLGAAAGEGGGASR